MKPPSPPAEGLNSSKYLSMGTASRMSDTNMPAQVRGGRRRHRRRSRRRSTTCCRELVRSARAPHCTWQCSQSLACAAAASTAVAAGATGSNVCHAPQAAMTDVPRFWPLLDCTILSRHSMTRSSLAPSSTSLHEARREAAATAVLSVCLVRGRDSHLQLRCGGNASRCWKALPCPLELSALLVEPHFVPLKLFCGFPGRAQTACARCTRMHG